MAEAKWYVVHVAAGSENRVAAELKGQFIKSGLGEFLEEVLVPKKEIIMMRRGVKAKVEERVVPGYVFVQMMCTPDTVGTIRRLPRVIGFLGQDAGNPRALSKREIEALFVQVDQEAQFSRMAISFEPGEVVKVCEGLFTSMQGVVEEISEEKSRLKVSIMILGRSTPVDLDFSQVEKCSQ